MSDIVERLRNWRTVHLARLHLLMEEAADEMERLRLTAQEREAVAYYLGTGGPYGVDKTLVALLSRTGSDAEKTGDDATECHSHGEKTPERERVANHPEAPDSSTASRSASVRVVRLPPLDPNGAPGWNAAIGAVREALADAGVDWDTE